VRSEEAQTGARMRVGESRRRSEWRGLTATISGMWGNPECLALDVRLEDRRTQLFWHHESGEIAERA
jgi:hypothetical protein